MSEFVVSILDYGAGNVRSLRNAVKHLGYKLREITKPEDIDSAQAILFPGQGCFNQAMKSLRDQGYIEPLKKYIAADRPFFGICLGMQLLFEGSEESPGEEGLGIIKGQITLFSKSIDYSIKIPQIGWNGFNKIKDCICLEGINDHADKVYFVHSYCALPNEANLAWILTMTDYGPGNRYISMVQKGNVMAAQFHPEKSGKVGLQMIENFLKVKGKLTVSATTAADLPPPLPPLLSLSALQDLPSTVMTNRVIACLDVRSNDDGDLVVTKGDQYDVRETSTTTTTASSTATGRGGVRNLGKPVSLCQRYYEQGADEVVFLNITSFRQGVIQDLPMLQVLEAASETVFVPLTVGGGIREYTDPSNGQFYSALEVAARYFRAGADKISIGSDAVYAAEAYLQALQGSTTTVGTVGTGTAMSSIEQISQHYGAQAVVISIDPKRVYLASPDQMINNNHPNILFNKTILPLPVDDKHRTEQQQYCWWQVTVKGGRAVRDLDAIQLARVCEILGAGEIMLNCIDMDGQNRGYDLTLIQAVQSAVNIPVIASSGAGSAQHFVDCFTQTSVHAALAAGIFHREEVKISEVKEALAKQDIPVRR